MTEISEKQIAVKFTLQELIELDGLLANGTCDFGAPGNEVAASAYDKIGNAWRKARRKQEKQK